jgi:hypothetical protein
MNYLEQTFKFPKMKRKDYGHTIHACPIQNFPEWCAFSHKYWGMGVSRKVFNMGCNMFGDNRERFKRHWGKCTFTFNGSHYFHCWLVDLGTAQVVVLTAREHGTCYEVVVSRDGKKVRKDIPKVLEFIEMTGKLPK